MKDFMSKEDYLLKINIAESKDYTEIINDFEARSIDLLTERLSGVLFKIIKAISKRVEEECTKHNTNSIIVIIDPRTQTYFHRIMMPDQNCVTVTYTHPIHSWISVTYDLEEQTELAIKKFLADKGWTVEQMSLKYHTSKGLNDIIIPISNKTKVLDPDCKGLILDFKLRIK